MEARTLLAIETTSRYARIVTATAMQRRTVATTVDCAAEATTASLPAMVQGFANVQSTQLTWLKADTKPAYGALVQDTAQPTVTDDVAFAAMKVIAVRTARKTALVGSFTLSRPVPTSALARRASLCIIVTNTVNNVGLPHINKLIATLG
jgi:hypothetical protein